MITTHSMIQKPLNKMVDNQNSARSGPIQNQESSAQQVKLGRPKRSRQKGVIHRVWTEEEDQFLRDEMGSYDLTTLTQMFNRFCKKKGWTKRSSGAISMRIYRLGGSVATEDVTTFGTITLAKFLGIHKDRINRWKKFGLGRYEKYGKKEKLWRVTIKQLHEFGKEHPEFFYNIPYDKLFYIFPEDHELCKKCLQYESPKTMYSGKKIKCVDLKTGEIRIFQDFDELYRTLYISRKTIKEAIRDRQGKTLGKIFSLLKD